MRFLPLLGVVGSVILATPASAQYFGQNKVQHRHLAFAVIQTEHFNVYYYDGMREAAIDGARMAERAYARLSRMLGHRYRERQPLVLFASHAEFQQNNVTTIGETTGGVTEPFRHRALLPFTGSYADFEHVLQHELVHQFQFDIFARGTIGAGIQQLVAVNPPLWFMEGMAEYLSLGPVDPQTAMWLRDAALEKRLPTIEQLEQDPRFTPYRFGHALWSYVAGRWGDEAVSRILQSASVSGVETAFRKTVGRSFATLSREWHQAVEAEYLPQLPYRQRAREFAEPVLTRERSSGTLHVSPALSPDGSQIAYLSEGKSFWIDLYLADTRTGRVRRRLIKSAFSAEFESLRFINSTGQWSPDGRFFAFAAKRGGADDLVIFDMERLRVHRRLALPLNGITTPSWAPDGTALTFTGHAGGFSDLYVVYRDGSGLRRLTNDPHADLHPVWAPDGRTIAFATDRGPDSDMETLELGPTVIALYHLATGAIELLDGMEGRNINPQWAPDGAALAFVSDRTGSPNLFLYELEDRTVHQLTHVYSGISGITPLSPAISWASRADRLAFTYYERGHYNVYRIDDPRSLKRAPPTGERITVAADSAGTRRDRRATVQEWQAPPEAEYAAPAFPGVLSVRQLLDSATLALPDSLDFAFKPYSPTLTPDYVVQPSIGYVRDNFGGGVFGGSAISLSDMLGNRRLFFATQLNGRLEEALFSTVYANLSRRTNWAIGITQDPRFFYTGSEFGIDDEGSPVFRTRLERFIVRQAFLDARRPFNRYRRVELGIRAVNVSRDAIDFVQPFDPATGQVFGTERHAENLETASFIQPTLALVFDNSVSVWVGPLMGRRSRFEYAPALGGWRYHQLLGDYRRYDHLGGFYTVAMRALFFGRFGTDSDQFPLFLGTPDLLRGYTAGSFRRDECLSDARGAVTGCGALDQLIGSRLAVFNAELRFPLSRNGVLGLLPIPLPPLEGAVFFDAGLAWNDRSEVVWGRNPEQAVAKDRFRTPLTSWGFSIRGNLLAFLILRADYSKPLSRSGHGAYWTLSIGPTF